MPKIDESRIDERPEGVTEQQWRQKLEYEAVQHEQDDTTRTSYAAREAAEAAAQKAGRRRK